jgi:heptosyltransferase III
MRRLLIRPGAIGDCILALPALEHLKADYTEVWVPSSVVPLIRFADSVRAISSTGIELVGVGDLDMPITLRAKLKSFDSIASWYGANRIEFREALSSLGARSEFFRALPPADFTGHAIDFFAQQVGAPSRLTPRILLESRTTGSKRPVRSDIAPGERRRTVVIHPFSSSARKNWPLDRFRELASQLPLRIEWTAGPEEELAEAIRFEDLGELASWMAGADLYIGNDSGITHLAAALGMRTLALFGPTSPRTWAPRGENVRVLHRRALETLTVECVLKAANRLLDSP